MFNLKAKSRDVIQVLQPESVERLSDTKFEVVVRCRRLDPDLAHRSPIDPSSFRRSALTKVEDGEPARLGPRAYESISETFPASLRTEEGDPGPKISSAMKRIAKAAGPYRRLATLPDAAWKIGSSRILRDELRNFAKLIEHYCTEHARLRVVARECIDFELQRSNGFDSPFEYMRIAGLVPDDSDHFQDDKEFEDPILERRDELRIFFGSMSRILGDIKIAADLAARRLKQDPKGRNSRKQAARHLANELAEIWRATTGELPAFSRSPKPESYCSLVATVFRSFSVPQNSQAIAKDIVENTHSSD